MQERLSAADPQDQDQRVQPDACSEESVDFADCESDIGSTRSKPGSVDGEADSNEEPVCAESRVGGDVPLVRCAGCLEWFHGSPPCLVARSLCGELSCSFCRRLADGHTCVGAKARISSNPLKRTAALIHPLMKTRCAKGRNSTWRLKKWPGRCQR